MPTTILHGETYADALHRRMVEEATPAPRQPLLHLSDDAVLWVEVVPSGIPDLHTLEIKRQYRHAQHPRWQLVLQVTGSACDLWELATLIRDGIPIRHNDRRS